ncbi:MAG TPA: gamma-glutamyl-gamma-aminobutyrate hydrolase family protein [Fimbriimonadaceae bacterium]|nr:gamma-glutamyl-gamma-aminobutyrate hydrolase family protein [Fimbriimonadaceae bacterium]
MRPVIGITVDSIPDPDDPRTRGKLSLNWNYAQAVADAGGVPILIPPMADPEQVAAMIDGWLIPGGADIDAARFGEENHPAVELQDPARYEAEAALMDRLDPETPIFGICYGCQFLNVARGGTLFQHLPDTVGHESHTGGTLQQYSLEESKLREATGAATVSGKSYHHQAVKDLGANLKVVATADDGTVEALEATDRPWVIGVQWHPERTLEDPATRRLFEEFIAAAAQYAKKRRLVAAP